VSTQGEAGALVGAVHALLFAAPGPLGLERLCSLTGASSHDVRRALAAVAQFYAGRASPGGVTLQEVAGGWQLVTAPEHARLVQEMGRSRPQPLSPAAMETLAIIAYRQPVTRAGIEAIRGVGVDGVLANLLDRGLVREAGRKQAPGRPVLYATTNEFLRLVGLGSLKDLPQPELKEPKEEALPS
jgi:segregation and condensation protein B